MAKLELRRTDDDPRRLELEPMGTLTFTGRGIRHGVAAAGDAEWTMRRTGLFGFSKEARDASGAVVGEYRTGKILGGELGKAWITWHGKRMLLRRSTPVGSDFELLDGDQELFTVKLRRWDKTRVDMATAWIEDWEAAEPGLVLFTLFAKFGEGKG